MNWLGRILITTLLLISPALAQSVVKYSDYASKGNTTATVQGMKSAEKFAQIYPGSTITVYNAGTLVLASIYSDSSSTPKANPFTSDSEGRVEFFAAPGSYDIRYSGTGIAVPFTRTNVQINPDKTYLDASVALKANINSPVLTGTPTAPSAPAGTSTTQIATGVS